MFVPLAGVVTIDNSDPIKDVFFDLFPVENGERLTDYQSLLSESTVKATFEEKLQLVLLRWRSFL